MLEGSLILYIPFAGKFNSFDDNQLRYVWGLDCFPPTSAQVMSTSHVCHGFILPPGDVKVSDFT